MRFAKLEVTIATAFWLAMFDYEVVDASGQPTTKIPITDLNDWILQLPKDRVYLKYRRRQE
jgi:hypothetical protein